MSILCYVIIHMFKFGVCSLFCTAYNVMACLFYYAAIAEEAHCGFVEGVLLKETFIYTGQDNQAG